MPYLYYLNFLCPTFIPCTTCLQDSRVIGLFYEHNNQLLFATLGVFCQPMCIYHACQPKKILTQLNLSSHQERALYNIFYGLFEATLFMTFLYLVIWELSRIILAMLELQITNPPSNSKSVTHNGKDSKNFQSFKT